VHYDAFQLVPEIKPWCKYELTNFHESTFNSEFLVERISGIGIDRDLLVPLNVQTQALLKDEHRRAAELEAVLAEREGQITSLEQAVAERRAALAEREGTIAALEQTVAQRQAALAEREGTIAALEQTVARGQAAATDLDVVLRAQARELELIKASLSWQMTAILRWLATKFPSLARPMRRSIKLLWWTATLQFVSRSRAWRRRRSCAQLGGRFTPRAHRPNQ
jgi:hypothetical protein